MQTIEQVARETEPVSTERQPVRFEKIVLLNANNPQQMVGSGALVAEGGSLRFETTDKKGNVTSEVLPEVRDIHYTRDRWAGSYVTIEFGHEPVRFLKVRDLSGGKLHAQAGTKTLADRLLRAVTITPLSTEQLAEIDRAARLGEKRQGVNHMLWGAIAAIVGLIVTVVTYSNASEGGGRYLIWWGPMLFGVFYFIWGVVQYTRRRPKI